MQNVLHSCQMVLTGARGRTYPAANPHGRRYHDRWYELLQGPLVDVLRVMTEPSEVADVLRKESPMSALVLPAERQRIFDSTRAD